MFLSVIAVIVQCISYYTNNHTHSPTDDSVHAGTASVDGQILKLQWADGQILKLQWALSCYQKQLLIAYCVNIL